MRLYGLLLESKVFIWPWLIVGMYTSLCKMLASNFQQLHDDNYWDA